MNSSLIILSTVHVQDFPDIVGDTAQNRKTIPILAPVVSRKLTSTVITFWSIYMAFIWRIGIWCSGVLISVGLVLAWRLWFLRITSEDRRSYVLYNVSSFLWFSMIKWLIFFVGVASNASASSSKCSLGNLYLMIQLVFHHVLVASYHNKCKFLYEFLRKFKSRNLIIYLWQLIK